MAFGPIVVVEALHASYRRCDLVLRSDLLGKEGVETTSSDRADRWHHCG